jgi:pimeloyl-ACP methyl ester carboxylesterase
LRSDKSETGTQCASSARNGRSSPASRVNGLRMRYIDEGTGDPVVLLHGNPAWGFLYRKFVQPLAAPGRRVIVPNMIGFGLSEKPTREQAHIAPRAVNCIWGRQRLGVLQRYFDETLSQPRHDEIDEGAQLERQPVLTVVN